MDNSLKVNIELEYEKVDAIVISQLKEDLDMLENQKCGRYNVRPDDEAAENRIILALRTLLKEWYGEKL